MPPSNRRPLYSEDTQQAADAPAVAALAIAAAPDPAQGAFNTAAPALSQASDTQFRQPCTLKGVASAAYAGALGYFLGFVPAGIKFKGRQWGMIHAQGVASASQLAIMSGMYTAVHCICQRIRMVEDGWNRGIAGCSTGLVLGWKAGPWSALQSCAGIGLLSALIDLGGGAAEAAEASMLGHLQQLRHDQQQLQATSGAHHPLQEVAALLASPLHQQQHVGLHVAAGHPSSSGHSGECSRQHRQQQLVAAVQAAAGPLPAAARQLNAAAQQLVAAVPPLAFLSACCSEGPVPSAAQSAGLTSLGLGGDTVDACSLTSAEAAISGRSGRRRH